MPGDATPTPFSKLLRLRRTEAGLSLYELAKRSGVDRSRISKRMEDGDIKVPTVEGIHKLVLALHGKVERILRRLLADHRSALADDADLLPRQVQTAQRPDSRCRAIH